MNVSNFSRYVIYHLKSFWNLKFLLRNMKKVNYLPWYLYLGSPRRGWTYWNTDLDIWDIDWSFSENTYYVSPQLALGTEESEARRVLDSTRRCYFWLKTKWKGMKSKFNYLQITDWTTLSIKIPLHICSCSIYFVRGKFSLWNLLLWNNLKIVLW